MRRTLGWKTAGVSLITTLHIFYFNVINTCHPHFTKLFTFIYLTPKQYNLIIDTNTSPEVCTYNTHQRYKVGGIHFVKQNHKVENIILYLAGVDVEVKEGVKEF